MDMGEFCSVFCFFVKKGAISDQVTSFKSGIYHSGLFTGMVKYIMKFNEQTGKTAKLVQQSG